jgi:hypothetical protein
VQRCRERARHRQTDGRDMRPVSAHSDAGEGLRDEVVVGLHPPAPVAPPHLPLHQQQALHAFLDRLLFAADDIFDCSTCLERYRGMSVRGTQCERCFHEVRLW